MLQSLLAISDTLWSYGQILPSPFQGGRKGNSSCHVVSTTG